MNWNQIRSWLGTVARLVLGIVFLIAGWQKLNDPRDFLRVVRAYDATPEWLSHGIAYGLPVLEVCIAITLIAGILVRWAAAITGLLLIVFLIGTIEVGVRGIKLECGCFGGGGATTAPTTYLLDSARDVGLLILAVFLVVWPITRISFDEFLARNDNIEMPSAKRMRSDQGQRKYNAMLEARKAEARTRTRYLAVSFMLLLVLIGAIGIGVQSNRSKILGATTATNATATNGVVLGKASKITIDIYSDFQCPFCQQFAAATEADINTLISSGKAEVRFHMVSFLDSQSKGNRYSSRAANASICASDIGTGTFLKYHDYLYSTQNGTPIQPKESSNGRTDTDFATYAKAIGIDGADLTKFQGCVQGETHKGLIEATTENWSERGYTGTPVLVVNGKQIANPSKAELDKAVEKIDPSVTEGAKATATPTDSTGAKASSTPSASATSSTG